MEEMWRSLWDVVRNSWLATRTDLSVFCLVPVQEVYGSKLFALGAEAEAEETRV
jgi:hypothetical protein